MEEFQDVHNPNQQIELIHTLHYGAIIKIAPSGEETNSNFMFCNGFILTNIILQNLSSNQEDTCGSLFRVVPNFLSEVQNHMVNEISETQNMKSFK